MEERVEIMVYVPAPGGQPRRGRHRAKGPGAFRRLLSFLARPFHKTTDDGYARLAHSVMGMVVLVGLVALSLGLGLA